MSAELKRIVNPDALNLPGIKVIAVQEQQYQYTFEAECLDLEPVPARTPCCNMHNVKYGTSEQRFRDLTMHGRYVEVLVTRQRYRCAACSKTRSGRLPHLDDGHRMTRRLTDYIFAVSPLRTFVEVGLEIGVDESTVRAVFTQRAAPFLRDWRPETPRVLGIDELHLQGQLRCVIGNVERRTLIDVLDSRKKATVDEYLSNMADKDRVEIVCMDMYANYRDLAREHFPKALIVPDKFHVVRMGNEAMDTLRRAVRRAFEDNPKEQLAISRGRYMLLKRVDRWKDAHFDRAEVWDKRYPLMLDGYLNKEFFSDIFRFCTSKQEARARYAEWEGNLTPDLRKVFKRLITAMNNWGPHIFDYFDHPFTNAYIEALNGLIGAMARNGRGYNLDILRVKAIKAYGDDKPKRKFQRLDVADFQSFASALDDYDDVILKQLEYGIPISTLQRLIETSCAGPDQHGSTESRFSPFDFEAPLDIETADLSAKDEV